MLFVSHSVAVKAAWWTNEMCICNSMIEKKRRWVLHKFVDPQFHTIVSTIINYDIKFCLWGNWLKCCATVMRQSTWKSNNIVSNRHNLLLLKQELLHHTFTGEALITFRHNLKFLCPQYHSFTICSISPFFLTTLLLCWQSTNQTEQHHLKFHMAQLHPSHLHGRTKENHKNWQNKVLVKT